MIWQKQHYLNLNSIRVQKSTLFLPLTLNPGLIYALLSCSTVTKVNTKPIDCPSYVILLINVTMVMKHYDLNCGVLFYHYNVLEIKTFRLVQEFKMSFQQQKHSVVFKLLYSDLRGHWDISFLPEVICSSNLIGSVKGSLRLLRNFC